MTAAVKGLEGQAPTENEQLIEWINDCLLYTSDAADE